MEHHPRSLGIFDLYVYLTTHPFEDDMRPGLLQRCTLQSTMYLFNIGLGLSLAMFHRRGFFSSFGHCTIVSLSKCVR